ncbi:hypothetical protein ACVWZX_004209 [Deinococcus sp. UYEF24]
MTDQPQSSDVAFTVCCTQSDGLAGARISGATGA